MAPRQLLLMLLIQLAAVCHSLEEESCEVTVIKNANTRKFNIQYNRQCNDTTTACPQFKPGRYICEQNCMLDSHRAIGLGIAAGLMLLLLVVVISGWICTCCLLYKTTEFSIKPKGLISLNQYQDNPYPASNNSFQPSTKYSRLGPNDEVSAKKIAETVMEEESMYEELDGEKDICKKERISGMKQSAIISGGPNEYYNTLKFQEP